MTCEKTIIGEGTLPWAIFHFRFFLTTRKNFVLEALLPNSSESEDTRKIRLILPNFTVK